MGQIAQIYQISRDAYDAAINGNLDEFETIDAEIDLDKAWHAISYLLTGKAELSFLGEGVQLDVISETAEVHAPETIEALKDQIADQTTQSILSKYDPSLFNELGIYAGVWDESGLEYIESHLDRFMTFIHSAAKKGNGLFVLIA